MTLDDSVKRTLEDERRASWKYLLPLDRSSRVLVISSALENTAVALARSAGHVTAAGLGRGDIRVLKAWAEGKGVYNLAAVADTAEALSSNGVEGFDVIVIPAGTSGFHKGPDALISACANALKPGGAVFLIGSRRVQGGPFGAMSAKRCSSMWERHGWRTQGVYAFLPGLEGYKLVVPVEPQAVFRSGLRMHNTLTLSGKVLKGAAVAVGAMRGLGRLIPGYALCLTRGGPMAAGGLPGYIRNKLGRGDLFTVVHNASPGEGAKAILKTMDASGKALAYTKVADNPHRGEFIEAEARTLGYLSALGLSTASVPEPVCYELTDGHYILMLKASEEKFGSNIRTMNRAVVDFLIELFSKTSARKTIDRSGFWAETASNLDTFSTGPFGKEHGWIKDLAYKAYNAVKGEELPFGMVHRDFVGWNIKRRSDGTLYVMDWEWSRRDFIPFEDFFHFILLTEWATSKKTVTSVLSEAFFSGGGRHLPYLEKYAGAVGVPLGLAYWLLILYLVEWTAFHIQQVTEVRQWASETLEFLEAVWSGEGFGHDRWLKG